MDAQVEEIARMWREQLRRPLPHDLPLREPYGSDLTLIDSSSAGCIDVFLKSPARFARDKKRLKVLRNCYEDLSQRWSDLAADEKEYFGHLLEIVSEISCGMLARPMAPALRQSNARC
jgi:hypothetical protein